MMGGSSLSLGLGLSDATKKKKIEEGQALNAKAKKYLETSMFKWKPDHLGAAPLMEKAAECYRAASDVQNAKQLFIEAANSHDMQLLSLLPPCSSKGTLYQSMYLFLYVNLSVHKTIASSFLVHKTIASSFFST